MTIVEVAYFHLTKAHKFQVVLTQCVLYLLSGEQVIQHQAWIKTADTGALVIIQCILSMKQRLSTRRQRSRAHYFIWSTMTLRETLHATSTPPQNAACILRRS